MSSPDMVWNRIPSRFFSARGRGDAGPMPRPTAAVGTSSRMWLKLQRVIGNFHAVPSPKRTVLSADGGKPCISPSTFGSVLAGSGRCCAGAEIVRIAANAAAASV